jgi:outer membrane protein
MKKLIGLGIICFFVLLGGFEGLAQEGPKMAFVNLNRVFDEYNKTAQFDKILEEKTLGYQKERNAKLEKIQEAERRMNLLKEDEREKLAVQIQKDKDALMEFDRQKQTDLRKERDEKIRDILLEIEQVIKDFAEKEKYDFIFNDRVLIYGLATLDLTETIISTLNKK